MDNPSDAQIARLLRNARRIAVVGLSSNPERTSYNVARYLLAQGYEIIPVNPHENEVLGQTAYPRLSAVPGPIDIVDIFRRPSGVPEAVRGAISAGAGAVWMQLGVLHSDAALQAHAAGLMVITERCAMVEYARLVIHGARIA